MSHPIRVMAVVVLVAPVGCSDGSSAPGSARDGASDAATEDRDSSRRSAAQAPAAAEFGEVSSYTEPTVKEVHAQIDFSLSAADFYAEFQTDSVAWAKKYEGRVVEVRGKLLHIASADPFVRRSGITVSLEAANGKYWNADLLHDRPWLDYPPGSQVVVRGRCRLGLSLLSSGFIVEAKPGPAVPELTADELHERFAADPQDFGQRFTENYVRIRGTVTGRAKFEDFHSRINDLEKVTITLGPGGRDLVKLNLGSYETRHLRRWQPGLEIVALGRFDAKAVGTTPAFKDVLPVSPLTDYPPLPVRLPRTRDGVNVLARAFTGELLGQWLSENPRALVMCFMTEAEAMGDYVSYLEVRGEVLAVEEADLPTAGRKKVRLKDDYGGLTAFEMTDAEIAGKGLRPGVTVTVLGAAHFSHYGFSILNPQITVN